MNFLHGLQFYVIFSYVTHSPYKKIRCVSECLVVEIFLMVGVLPRSTLLATALQIGSLATMGKHDVTKPRRRPENLAEKEASEQFLNGPSAHNRPFQCHEKEAAWNERVRG